MKYEAYFKTYLEAVEQTLEAQLPPASHPPAVVHEAMRYAVFPAGKRFRPILALAACEACGGSFRDALVPAAALEFIHCYSLVHDDLPALDNDDERRGQPSCHKKFGEAMAILAGDGLLNHAFAILAQVQPSGKAVQLLQEISTSAGTYGMIGGQVAELAADSKLTLPMLDYISIHKTGMLIKAAAVSGALAAGASREMRARMTKYGEALGLAFQLIDDCLDRDGYLHLIKEAELRQKVRNLIAHAKREIHPLGRKSDKLQFLADYLLKRLPRGRHVSVDR